jgi:hypothetical protein
MKPRRAYRGPYPDTEMSLYLRSIHGVFELLEQIYIQYPPLTIYGKNERWYGIVEFYRTICLISRSKPGQINVPFVCRKVGNS